MIKNLKNYSTDIRADKTIIEVQQILAQSGARGIAFEYDNSGNIESLFFRLAVNIPTTSINPNDNQKEVSFKLPAKPDAVYKVLFEGKRFVNFYQESKRKEAEDRRKQQSLNVAWRIMKEWLEVQFSLIRLNQVEAIEIFLPYMVTGKDRTLYNDMKEKHFELGSGAEEGKIE